MPTKATSSDTGPSRPPMLTEVLREQLRVLRYARRTEEVYVGWTREEEERMGEKALVRTEN